MFLFKLSVKKTLKEIKLTPTYGNIYIRIQQFVECRLTPNKYELNVVNVVSENKLCICFLRQLLLTFLMHIFLLRFTDFQRKAQSETDLKRNLSTTILITNQRVIPK